MNVEILEYEIII